MHSALENVFPIEWCTLHSGFIYNLVSGGSEVMRSVCVVGAAGKGYHNVCLLGGWNVLRAGRWARAAGCMYVSKYLISVKARQSGLDGNFITKK